MGALLGVLGGMGPLATVDFLKKLIEETPAARDADHVPVVVYSVPQIPDRPKAILESGDSPLPAMLHGMRVLRQAGARAAAIACNTAHYWCDELERESGLPILHIADATYTELARQSLKPDIVGLIATKGTVAAGFFQQRLTARGCRCLIHSAVEQDELVLPAIECVKRNDLAQAHQLTLRAIENLLARGAQAVVLGCTEIPLAVEYAPNAVAPLCIDPTRALARACVGWWHSQQ